MQEIFEGLIIGAGAGVTTALILGIWRWLIRSRDRHEQVSYIRDVALHGIERISSLADLEPPSTAGDQISADHSRFVYCHNLQRELRVTLSWRASALTYQEVSSLQQVLSSSEAVISSQKLEERLIMPEKFAQTFCMELKALGWLKIPDEENS